VADNEVTLEITASTKDAEKALGDFAKKANSSLSGIESSFKALKTAAIAAVAFVASREIVQFFEDGVAAAIAQEQALAKLSKQLELSGQLTDGAIASFSAFADELERTTKYEDDAVLSASALAASYGKTTDQTQELVRAATELAAVTGQDLNSAVETLGKTYSGSTGLLAKQIPALKSLTEEQLKSGEAIDFILKRFGGSATAEIQTFQGAIDQTAKAFGNFQESFGQIITGNDALKTTIQALGQVFESFQDIVADNADTIGTVLTVAVKGLAVSFSLVARGVVEVAKYISSFVSSTIVGLALLTDGAAQAVKALSFGKVDFTDTSASILEFAANSEEKLNGLNNVFDSIAGATDKVAIAALSSGNAVAKASKSAQKDLKQQAVQTGLTAAEIGKLSNEAKKFEQDLTKAAADEAGKISIIRSEQLSQVDLFFKSGVINAEKSAKLKLDIERKFNEDTQALREKDAKESADMLRQTVEDFEKAQERKRATSAAEVSSGLENPLGAIIDPSADKSIAAGVGAVKDILDGAAGATKLVSKAVGAIADTLLPGIGSTVAAITEVLAGGPEKIKELVSGFVKALPEVIKAISDALPVLIIELLNQMDAIISALIQGAIYFVQTLVKNIPAIIQALIAAIPRVIQAFVAGIPAFILAIVEAVPQIIQALVDNLPAVITALVEAIPVVVDALIENLPTIIKAIVEALPEIAIALAEALAIEVPKALVAALAEAAKDIGKSIGTAIADGFKDAVGGLFSGGGGGGGSGVGKITKALGFAEGGTTPSNIPSSGALALVHSDELVIPKDDLGKFRSLIDALSSSSSKEAARGGSASSGSQNLTINLKVGEKQLANVLLDLNRQGFRIA